MREIKSLKVRPCDHEYEHQIFIDNFKPVGQYGVIRGMNTIHGVCELCGHNKTEIVGAGYVFLKNAVVEHADG